MKLKLLLTLIGSAIFYLLHRPGQGGEVAKVETPPHCYIWSYYRKSDRKKTMHTTPDTTGMFALPEQYEFFKKTIDCYE